MANLSKGELKLKLFENLRKQGVVDNIKTQLRNHLLDELKAAGKVRNDEEKPATKLTLELRVLNSLVARHLHDSSYLYTKSVFIPVSFLYLPSSLIFHSFSSLEVLLIF
jgi:hypothetical protein